MTIYNQIGKGYNSTRQADPYIAQCLYELLVLKREGKYLDIGCGTGNYFKALREKGVELIGVDPSEIMLETARRQNPSDTFIEASADALPFDAASYDGAMAVLTLHHWPSIPEGLKEIRRVLKRDTALCIFSYTPEQMRGYWLYHYFPKMVETCMKIVPDLSSMQEMLTEAGFSEIHTKPYFVKPDLQDHFIYSYKFQPEKYLLEEVRNNTSGFRVFADPLEVEEGIKQLAKDIKSGAIDAIISSYENDLGDYLFIQAIA
jgi:ubiquinone/menaquinone biosynthesis C-methylase UbiE